MKSTFVGLAVYSGGIICFFLMPPVILSKQYISQLLNNDVQTGADLVIGKASGIFSPEKIFFCFRSVKPVLISTYLSTENNST